MTAFTIVDLDRRVAPKSSLPLQIAVPTGEDPLPGELTRAVAADWAREYLAGDPESPIAPSLRQLIAKDLIWREAEPYLLAEDWAAAQPLLEQVVDLDPTDLAAYFNLASCKRGLGLAAQALADLQAIEDGFGDEGVYHANVGRTYEELNEREKAVAAYQRALDLLPGDAFVLDRLVALGVLVRAFDEGGQALLVDAEAFADSVRSDLAQHAGDAEYLAAVGSALLDGGHDDLARNAAELALSADPARSDALLVAGVAYARLGRLPEALARLDQHVAVEPNSAGGHANRGHVLHGLGRREEAVTAGRRTLELNPNDVGAIQLIVAGDDGPAASLARVEALALELVGSWAVERVAGDLLFALDDGDGAIGRWGRAVALGADDGTIGMLLGELGRLDRLDELCAIADDLPMLSSRDPGLRWNVANGYAASGRVGEARIIFAQIAHDEAVDGSLRSAAAARIAGLAAP